MTPRTQAGRNHGADYRNLLAFAEAAGNEYGQSKGRVMPGMEMLQKAVTILRAGDQYPELAIEAEAAAAAEAENARLRKALEFALREWESHSDDLRVNNEGEDGWLATANDAEAQMYRQCRSALAAAPAPDGEVK